MRIFRGVFPKSSCEARRNSSYDRHNYPFSPKNSKEHHYTELQALSKQDESIGTPVNQIIKVKPCSDSNKFPNRLSVMREFGNGSDLRRPADRDDGLSVWRLDAGHGKAMMYGDNSKRTICSGAANAMVKTKTPDTGQSTAKSTKNKLVLNDNEAKSSPKMASADTNCGQSEGASHRSDEACTSVQSQEACKTQGVSMEDEISFHEMLAAANGPRCRSSNR